jgi:hypothetical protein
MLVGTVVPLEVWAQFPVSIEESLGGRTFESRLDPPTIPLISGDAGNGEDTAEGGRTESGPSDRARMIIGGTLLGSGIFLCSWGITAWEVQEYQSCPARNTGNVVKIVAGIMLVNAGLIYLLGDGD